MKDQNKEVKMKETNAINQDQNEQARESSIHAMVAPKYYVTIYTGVKKVIDSEVRYCV